MNLSLIVSDLKTKLKDYESEHLSLVKEAYNSRDKATTRRPTITKSQSEDHAKDTQERQAEKTEHENDRLLQFLETPSLNTWSNEGCNMALTKTLISKHFQAPILKI